jgi:uncharacterized protein YbjT (DUF2867 family)
MMILITGATGNVGKEITPLLFEKGIPFRAFVRSREEAEKLRQRGAQAFVGDLSNAGDIDKSLEQIDTVYLLSAFSPQIPELEKKFVDIAKSRGSIRIVKHSVLEADPADGELLFGWHGKAETYLINSGLDYTILRPNAFQQNFFQHAGTIVSDGAFYAPMENAAISHIDVRDIAGVAVSLLLDAKHHHQVYEITGPESLTYAQVAEKLSQVTGTSVRFVNISLDALRQGALANGLPEIVVQAFVDLYVSYQKGKSRKVTDTVKQLTGKEPRKITDFFRENSSAFKKK